MAIHSTLLEQVTKPNKIYVTQPETTNLADLRATLADLAGRGQITERDEVLLETLRELGVLSLDQIRRLLWPAAKERTAYNRLCFLVKHQLLGSARTPRLEMAHWGLPARKVYAVGLAGWLWLKQEVNRRIRERHLFRDLVLHNLLAAEVYVRLVEAVRGYGSDWSLVWAGEQGAGFYVRDQSQPLIEPDGLGIIRRQLEGHQTGLLPFFLELDRSREGHGRPSSDWGRKVAGYNQFYTSDWKLHPQLGGCPTFPTVAVVTHGEQRLSNLLDSILKHRREPVVYYLAQWEGLIGPANLLSAPVWAILSAEGKVIGREAGKRQPLVRA